MSRADAWANSPSPPVVLARQSAATRRIDELSIDQARMIADLLRDQAEANAVDAQKRRTDALRAHRAGQQQPVTHGRLHIAEQLDDAAAELFALADWTERQAQLVPTPPPVRKGWLR